MSTASVGIRASKPFTPGPPPPGVPPGSISMNTPDAGWYVLQQGPHTVGSVSYGSYIDAKGLTVTRVTSSNNLVAFRTNNTQLIRDTMQPGGTIYLYLFGLILSGSSGVGNTPAVSGNLVNNIGNIVAGVPPPPTFISAPYLGSAVIPNVNPANYNYLYVQSDLNSSSQYRVDQVVFQFWYKGP